ncbi:DUF190 domain-containing protein [Aquifex aeolicus]|uniref:UPF0166 protein aq_450 n=1 Tax=Aquifex aeolicus (strain VF5) TaxID=224324 RepID=Y450_AQUAE|nr:DUF190 domain-containing protein [Aquifex aeolicus]O66758.1 RecName: Full=UPF0166 protein aq_450 [Aquifex aeolicus VF5]AAC06718.1 putative protein [Aquifex aeolicus VF5]
MRVVKKKLLRIFTSEDESFEGKPFYKYLLERAKERGLEGATVFRAIAGYGKTKEIRKHKLFQLRSSLPVVVEIIDEEEKIKRFLEEIKGKHNGLITLEDVEVIYL